MTVALATVLVGLLTVVLTTGSTVWHRRTRGPEAHAQIVNASTGLLEQLQTRIGVLETRVDLLEAENIELTETVARYYFVYGPLPE